jgi:hypothetical protein
LLYAAIIAVAAVRVIGAIPAAAPILLNEN